LIYLIIKKILYGKSVLGRFKIIYKKNSVFSILIYAFEV